VAEPSGAACVGVSPSHSCWAKWGRWEFASHPLGMPGGKGGCAGGKHIRCLDDAIPAMNQKNSFAAMTGRGLGLSPKARELGAAFPRQQALLPPSSHTVLRSAQGLPSWV